MLSLDCNCKSQIHYIIFMPLHAFIKNWLSLDVVQSGNLCLFAMWWKVWDKRSYPAPSTNIILEKHFIIFCVQYAPDHIKSFYLVPFKRFPEWTLKKTKGCKKFHNIKKRQKEPFDKEETIIFSFFSPRQGRLLP